MRWVHRIRTVAAVTDSSWEQELILMKHMRGKKQQHAVAGASVVLFKIFTPDTRCTPFVCLDPPLDESFRCRSTTMKSAATQSTERKTNGFLNKSSQKAGVFASLMLT